MQILISKLKALSDPNRFRIIMMLKERTLCVCELLEVLEIAGGTLSNHLKILKNADLIEQTKDGRWVEYHIKDENSLALINQIEEHLTDRKQIEKDKDYISRINRDVCTTGSKKYKTAP